MDRLKVAIAEDDFRIADIHEKFLKNIPEVIVVGKALSAQQTMELLRREPIDLLLLDIYMPDQLGTDLLLSIRQEFPKLDVVMITAATDKVFLETAMRNGVFNYLIKPVSMERFVNMFRKYLEHKSILDRKVEVDQALVDQLFEKGNGPATVNVALLPKGIDAITLEKVMQVLIDADCGLSAEQVGERMGASRTTARRYLEYLISVQKCRAEVEYGVVGRPERHYYHK